MLELREKTTWNASNWRYNCCEAMLSILCRSEWLGGLATTCFPADTFIGSQLAAFSLLSLRSYKLFQCDEIIVSFFLLQFLCITKPQGRIFTMKIWALCITRPALCFSTQDWSCKVYVSLILTPKIWLAIFLFNFYVCSCRSVTRNCS